jgi:hypothetical protein
MRINFAATYQEVQNLLKASAKPVKVMDDAAFEASLGSLISQPLENSSENQPKAMAQIPAKSAMEEVRASYKFQDPSLEMPGMAPMSPPAVDPTSPENGGMSVKTPTLLEARRVDLSATPESTGPVAMLNPTKPEPLFTPGVPDVDSIYVDKGVAQSPDKVGSSPRPKVLSDLPPQLGQREILSRLGDVSEKVGLNPALTKSLVQAESGFNVRAVSSDGHASKGLFQLLDSTGMDLMSRNDLQRQYDPFDPDLNMELGTSYLKYLHDIFRTPTSLPNDRTTRSAANDKSLEQLAVAAYNAGEGRVAHAQLRTERAGKDPAHYANVAPFLPRSTREYVARVVEGKKLF